jgi:hypothetical protein
MKRIVTAVLTLLVLPATSSAATVVGDATSALSGAAPAETGFVQLFDGGGASYAFPTAGVVTSMSANALNSTAGTRSVRVLVTRAVTETTDQFTVVGGANLTFTTTAPALQSAPARIPVKAGDRLGGYAPNNIQFSYHAATGGGIAGVPLSIAPADGETFATTTGANGVGLSVSATLEPDADADGYGDDTQDSCPTLAQIHAGACTTDLQITAKASPATIVQGQSTAIVATVTNAGAQPASATTATVSVPAGLELLATSATDGLGDIPAGASRKVYVLVRGTDAGTASVSIAAASAVPESTPGDNTASTPITVTAPPAATPNPTPGPSATPTPTPTVALCIVPKLKGKTKAAATTALTKAGCKAGKIRGKKGKVRTQTVPAKTKVLAGTKVGFRIRK